MRSYFRQLGQADHTMIHVINFTAVSTTAASVADVLPHDLSMLASGITIVWMSLQIWDMPRFQKFLEWIKHFFKKEDKQD